MGARDLLARLADAGLTVEVEAGRLLVRPASKLTDDLRLCLKAEKADVLAMLASSDDQPCSADAWCWPHSDAMNTAELNRMASRLRLFERRGIADAEADRMADKLMILERQGSTLRACLACYRLAGGAADGWRCMVDRPAVVDRLRGCDAFTGPGFVRP